MPTSNLLTRFAPANISGLHLGHVLLSGNPTRLSTHGGAFTTAARLRFKLIDFLELKISDLELTLDEQR